MYRRARSKYGARKTVVDGIEFDSRKEAERYIVLRDMQKKGEIQGLELQKKFLLIPKQTEPDHYDFSKSENGRKVKGKVIEREVSYYADFWYFDNLLKEWICEDTKGMKTNEYILKRKLMLWVHGIRIREL
jgi:hypothetical protein